jgi:bla regulator protein BlaR1
MIAESFGYAMVVASLVGLAAASVELLLAELKRPRRFAWLGAFAVALASPPLLWLLAPEPRLPLAVTRAFPQPSFAAAYAQFDWDTALLWVWLAATTVLATLYVAAWLRLALQAKRWPRETTDTVSVVVADDVGPAVLGFLRPWIVLPRWLMDAPPTVRSTVVAHELEHIAARDQAWIVTAQLITILLPWNLPLWWFMRRFRAAIEIDCDARVLGRGTDPAQYADVLLAVGQHGPASAYVAVTLIEPVTQLERRIRIMLTKPRSASIGRVSAAATVAAALAACATQLDAPVIVADSTQAALGTTELSLLTSLRDGIKVTEGPDGQVTTLSGVILVHVAGPSQMRITSERMITQGESAVFEGDVRIDSDGTSITAARALTTRNPKGEMVLTVEDAKVIHTFAEPAKLSE